MQGTNYFIHNVMNRVVMNYHKKHIRGLEITFNVEAYIQARVLKTMLEAISYDFRRESLKDISELLVQPRSSLPSTDLGGKMTTIATV